MKYKSIALDLDGTLVNKFNKISKQSYESLLKYIDHGGQVWLVTGRSINSALKIANKIYEKISRKIDFISASNGAIIFNYKDNSFLNKEYINSKISHEILNYFKNIKSGCLIFYSEDNKVYSYNSGITLRLVFKIRGFSLKKITKDTNLNSYKINIIKKIPTKGFLNTSKALSENFINEIESSKTSKVLTEITKKNVNKGYAIEKLSFLNNISKEEIAYLGDSSNDIPAFKVVGTSVLVNNKRVKETNFKPTYCLNKTTKNGLKYFIENIILKNEK